MIQHSLLAMMDEVARGRISIETVVERMCHTPARLFQMKNRGYIKEGYYADMTMVELNSPWRVHREGLLSKCGWSAMEDRMFSSRVRMTMVGGRLAYVNGRAVRAGGEREIEFDR
jgi:dihydroorotase